jgi:four helix bundle protein
MPNGGGEAVGADELKQRTKQFALRAIKLVDALPTTTAGKVLGRQFLRAGTSVGANYRAACRARSKAEFIAKLGIVEEEADESLFWLELIEESGLMPKNRLIRLQKEADELTAIMAASRISAKKKGRDDARSIGNRQSAIAIPQSAIRNPQSAIRNPKS